MMKKSACCKYTYIKDIIIPIVPERLDPQVSFHVHQNLPLNLMEKMQSLDPIRKLNQKKILLYLMH